MKGKLTLFQKKNPSFFEEMYNDAISKKKKTLSSSSRDNMTAEKARETWFQRIRASRELEDGLLLDSPLL